MPDEPLMGVRELSEFLQVDMSTIYIWSRRGQIPAMKVAKMWRYRRSEIEEWLNQRRSQPFEREVPPPQKQ
jgi:PTS system nitrogen regulatory IIA component